MMLLKLPSTASTTKREMKQWKRRESTKLSSSSFPSHIMQRAEASNLQNWLRANCSASRQGSRWQKAAHRLSLSELLAPGVLQMGGWSKLCSAACVCEAGQEHHEGYGFDSGVLRSLNPSIARVPLLWAMSACVVLKCKLGRTVLHMELSQCKLGLRVWRGRLVFAVLLSQKPC